MYGPRRIPEDEGERNTLLRPFQRAVQGTQDGTSFWEQVPLECSQIWGSMAPSTFQRTLTDALGLADGASPFPWQQRLLGQFLDGDIPRSLDVPTGLGKTASMAIWLVARALGADVPTRLVYIVDRRVVVDQATHVAEGLRAWLARTPHLTAELGLGPAGLPISTLRGQHVDNREWLSDPSRPAIVVGTVDMIGSRLLFGGYRASRKMRPFMAGLLGHDALFVLDEAHLVPPFERLLERAIANRGDLGGAGAFGVAPPPPRLLSLSATGRSRGGAAFDLANEDHAHPIVVQRLTAAKHLKVRELPPGAKLARAAAEEAWDLAAQGEDPIRCIVYLSRRADAESAKAHLEALAGIDKKRKAPASAETELLVGGRRVHERRAAAQKLQELGFMAGTAADRARPHFLFATSAGEVGVDLDADHMVCDLVAWERMVQRLGRVNRLGRGAAKVRVLDEQRDDAWAESVRRLLAALPATEGGQDASPGALREVQIAAQTNDQLQAHIQQASTPEPLYPHLDRPTLDAWSMTSLADHTGRPAIAPWLRGWIDARPQTTLAFRKHLPARGGQALAARLVERFFEAAPLHTIEQLEAKTSRVADWLKKRARKLKNRLDHREILGFWRVGRNKFESLALAQLHDLAKKELLSRLEGAELILDRRFGGLSIDGLLDPTARHEPVTMDSDDEARIDGPVRVRERKLQVAGDPDRIRDRDDVWRERERILLSEGEDGDAATWLVVERRLGDYETEEDRSASSRQSLAEHHAWTAERARDIATRLGLGDQARDLLVLASRLHDEGKRSKRWQRAFRAPGEGGPYAKTAGPINTQLLDGYRHEFGSLPFAQQDPDVQALDADARDLVLHLIASHHGYARPTIRTTGDDSAPPSALATRAREIALRFSRLQAKLGPWGLAWWEALLRSADQCASRDLELSTAGATQEAAV